MPIFSQKVQLCIFKPKFAQKLILGLEFQETNVGIRSNISRYHMSQLSDKTGNFVFLGPNLSKNQFWGRKFRKLMLGLESASLRYHMSLFLDKRDNFDILGQNLPKKDFLSEIQETKVGIRIRILKIP